VVETIRRFNKAEVASFVFVDLSTVRAIFLTLLRQANGSLLATQVREKQIRPDGELRVYDTAAQVREKQIRPDQSRSAAGTLFWKQVTSC
jgi:hypothetical protein